VVITFRGITLKSGEIAYEILSIRDFGIGMRRRNVKVQLLDYSPSRDQLMKITEIIWKEHGQDVEELTTVFFFARDGSEVSGVRVWGMYEER